MRLRTVYKRFVSIDAIGLCYDSPMKKKALPIQLDETEREKIEALAAEWGISLSGVIRRLIREYKNDKP